MAEAAAERNRSHDLSEHPVYRCWIQIKSRCLNKNTPEYPRYGARGITICDRWINSFQNFWEDMGPTWKKGLSIERKEMNGNYEPGNCRWATAKEQAWNRRSNRIIETPKGRMLVVEAAKEFGISQITIHSRIRYGWPEADLLKPLQQGIKNRKPNPR